MVERNIWTFLPHYLLLYCIKYCIQLCFIYLYKDIVLNKVYRLTIEYRCNMYLYIYTYNLRIHICNIHVHSAPILFLCYTHLICIDSDQSEIIECKFLLLHLEFLGFWLFPIGIPGSIERINVSMCISYINEKPSNPFLVFRKSNWLSRSQMIQGILG